jgi:hypothetical protein
MFAAVMEQRPQLMSSAAAGDADSFAMLIEPLLDPAYRLAAVMLADRLLRTPSRKRRSRHGANCAS